MKKLIRIVSVFLALRIGELIFGVAILGLFTYLGVLELAQNVKHLPRIPASILSGASSVFVYYFFTGYLFTSLATPLLLAVRPNPSLAELSGANAGAFFISACLPLPVFLILYDSADGLLWLSVLIFDALFPICFRSCVKDVAFTATRKSV